MNETILDLGLSGKECQDFIYSQAGSLQELHTICVSLTILSTVIVFILFMYYKKRCKE